MRLTSLRPVIAALAIFSGFAAKSDITLAWDAAQGGAISNYTLYWGTNTGVYTFAATCPGFQTNLQVTGLIPNTVYYFSVVATALNGTISPFSNEIIVTNAPTVVSNTPPPPPPGMSNIVSGGTNGGTNGGGGGGGTNGGSGSNTANTSSNGLSSEFTIVGVPPVLKLSITNNHPYLTISGTVGSDLAIQSTTTAGDPDSWASITNLAMTNLDATAQTNAAAGTLNVAFVPATQGYEVVDTVPPSSEFYRVVMPYDYAVLADAVLSGKGFPSRTLLVRMPGVVSDDVCYVTPQSSYVHYDSTNRAFSLQPSGASIRQIANTLSSSLGLNWTSASEFVYSNGVSSILATVVETEDPATDPVAGAATASIQIDF